MFKCDITDSIYLKLYEQSQAETIYNSAVANREHLRTWLSWVDNIKTLDDTREFIKKSLDQFTANDGFQCGIWEGENYLGGIGFHWFNRANDFTEIGYWLAKEAEGRGIITACCRKMIDHAFDAMKLNKVEIRCATGNERSRAVPKRLGFIEEGTVRQINKIGDVYNDLVVYGMLASEWKQLRLQPPK